MLAMPYLAVVRDITSGLGNEQCDSMPALTFFKTRNFRHSITAIGDFRMEIGAVVPYLKPPKYI